MKKFLAILSLASISLPAMAMHAYGEDSCTAMMINGTSLEIVIANGQPANPHKILNDENSDEFISVEFKGAEIGGDEEGSPLVLEKMAEKIIKKRNTFDGCFEGYQQNSTRVARVKSVSKELAAKYEIKSGSTINFVCYTSFSAPSGKSCH